jgi:hypothetical protein
MRSFIRRHVKIGFAIFSLSTNALALHAEGSLKELSGQVRACYYDETGKVGRSQTMKFTMVTDGTRYRARLEKPGEDMATDYIEVAWDGTNSYYVDAMPTWVEKQREKGIATGTNIATACVTSIPVPQFPFAEPASILWCSYVSASYLVSLSPTNPVFTPFLTFMKNGSIGQTSDFLMLSAGWRLSPKMDYVEELHYVCKPDGTDGGSSYTNAIFNSLTTTNLGGWEIPSHAIATLFVRNANGGGTSKAIEYVLDLGSAVDAERVVNEFQPVVPGTTAVTEERFNSPDANLHFMYLMKTNWPSTVQAKATTAYQQAATALPAIPTVTHEIPRFLKLIFLLLAAAPLLILWNRRKVQTNEE